MPYVPLFSRLSYLLQRRLRNGREEEEEEEEEELFKIPLYSAHLIWKIGGFDQFYTLAV